MAKTGVRRRRLGGVSRGLVAAACLILVLSGLSAQDPDVLRKLQDARESLTSGRVDRAEREANRALEQDPNSADVRLFICDLRQVQGRHEDAVDACRTAATLAPKRADIINHLADLLTQRESDFPEAITWYYRALALDPNDPDPLVSVGSLMERTGRLVEAEASYREALRINPNTVRAIAGLGAVLFKTDRFDEARFFLLRAAELRPRDLRSHIFLGLALNHAGQLDLALQELRTAAIIDPHAANMVAGVREQREHFERLRGIYLNQLEASPKDATIWHNIAILSYYLRDYASAWKHLVRAQQLDYPVDLGFKEVVYARWRRGEDR